MRARFSARPDDYEREKPLLEFLPVGLLLLDEEARVLALSAEMERMMGCRLTSLSDCVPDSDDFPRAEILEALREAVRGWSTSERTVSLDRQSRRHVLLRTAVGPGNADGDRMVAMVIELTEIIRQGRLSEDFMSQVRHDLRGPLTSMRGGVDLLRTERVGRLNERQSRLLDLLERACHQMIGIVSAAESEASAERAQDPRGEQECSPES